MNRSGFTYSWHQDLTDPFDEAEFYEPGPIVTVRRGSLAVSVERDGVALWSSITDSGLVTVEKAADFRERFPTGLPTDNAGWTVTYNGWFDLYDATEGRSDDPNEWPIPSEGGHIDNVTYSLKEAIDDAERILEEAPSVDPD